MKLPRLVRSLLNSGIDSSVPETLRRHVLVTNFLGLLLVVLTVLYTLIFYVSGSMRLASVMFSLTLLFAIVVFLNRKKRYDTARLFLVIVANFAVAYFALALGPAASVETVYYAFALLPSIIFHHKAIKWIAFSITFPFCLHLYLKHFGYQQFSMLDVPPQLPLLIHNAIVPTLYLLVLTPVFYLVKLMTEYEAQVAAQQLQIIAAAKMSTLGEMAGGIAHEINNPLAIIEARSRQITVALRKVPPLTDTAIEFSESIRNTTARIASIIKGLRAFARNAEHDPFCKEKLASIVSDTLVVCSERFVNSNIDLRYAAIPDELEIECRAAQISQVLTNLLSNAFDAIRNLPERWVAIDISTTPSHVQIRVTDSGVGIPTEIVEKMMQPFFTTKEVGKGTGLGLSISFGIVQAHSGTLVYELYKRHTSFLIELPRMQNS